MALFEKLRNKREILRIDFSTIKIINTGLEPAITPRLIYISNVCKNEAGIYNYDQMRNTQMQFLFYVTN